MSISVKRYNFALVFFKAASHANPGADRNFAGSSFYVSLHILLNFSNKYPNNNVLL